MLPRSRLLYYLAPKTLVNLFLVPSVELNLTYWLLRVKLADDIALAVILTEGGVERVKEPEELALPCIYTFSFRVIDPLLTALQIGVIVEFAFGIKLTDEVIPLFKLIGDGL